MKSKMKQSQLKPTGGKAMEAKKPTVGGAAEHVITGIQPVESLKKDKLIRDSFTLPREDFELIALLKDRALDFKRPTKKSELLRAGLQALAGLDQARLRASLEALRPLKAGRPKNKA
jgi:hypothetical protein